MIGEAIRYHLELNGCSQYKLAARLVCNRATVKKFCSDDANPTFHTLIRVAKALNIKVSDLVKTAEKLKEDFEK